MRWILPLIIVFTCLGCDQITKHLATEHLKQAPPKSYLGDTVRIQYAENPGAFLGAGGGLSKNVRFWLLVVVNSLFLCGISWIALTRRTLTRWQLGALSLLLAGGVGNLLDRVFNGGLVIDFLNVGIGPVVRTGIFNVADMAISLGFVLLILLPLRSHDTPSSNVPTTAAGS